jgi:hypothetical protein
MTPLTSEADAMYDELSSELRSLNQAWRYVHDMTSDLTGVNTFNKASAPYFGTVLSALFEYGLVILSRLLDPPKTGKYDNCSLSALAQLADGPDQNLVSSLNSLRERAATLLEYRHKQIAHLDKVVTLTDTEVVPHLFSWVRMQETLTDLGRWMNHLESELGLPPFSYAVDDDWGDADHVRDLLRKGMSA